MSSRQGGKAKPLKVRLVSSSHFSTSSSPFSIRQAPKKEKKELDEDDVAFQQKKKAEEAAIKAARDKGAFPCSLPSLSSLRSSFLQLPRVRK